ncbi:MAG: hypothetical protein IH905_05305 [Proteobacteria bacterium]|nr:hypothetical protein [Pseudomonadota bacterium]
MTDFSKKSVAEWRSLAEREAKGRTPEDLSWRTPEGIGVKALYTAEDLDGIEASSDGWNGILTKRSVCSNRNSL